jgi:dTDP-4-amino-4,6-dideoxygalactose transaminase
MSESLIEMEYVKKAFYDNFIAPQGPNVDLFEREISKIFGGLSTVALNSGTSALHLALKSIEVSKDDYIAISSFTFAAPANAINYLGAIPIFIDSDYLSWNMDPYLLEDAFLKFGKKLKAVLIVHSYGFCANLNEIKEICKKYDAPLIEDAAEALGSKFDNIPLGSHGFMGILSFNGNKIITTSSGGMVISKSLKHIDKIKFWSQQSREDEKYYLHKEIGYNYRLSNVLAGIGLGQLSVLSERVKKKRLIYEFYQERLSSIFQFHPIVDGLEPNYWLTCVLAKTAETRDFLMETLDQAGIETRHLWNPMHMQPVFESNVAFLNGVSNDLFNRGLCLPSDTKMMISDIEEVCSIIVKANTEFLLK